jgi:MFS family permease
MVIPHALMGAGEATMAVALAGSSFISVTPDAARSRVLLFLTISMAPFAVVAPLIGPVIDRMSGGRRLVVQIAAFGRALVTFLMIRHLDSLLLFPEVFAALVLAKTYTVSKAALVPSIVGSDQELVEANSKLGIISGVAGFAAAVPAGIIYKVAGTFHSVTPPAAGSLLRSGVVEQASGPKATLVLTMAVFAAAFVAATRLPREAIAEHDQTSEAIEELSTIGVRLASSGMAILRASVGFLFFQLLFFVRRHDAGIGWVGAGLAASSMATMLGNAAGPRLRRRVREELMLIGALFLAAAAGIATSMAAGLLSSVVLMAAVNGAAAVGKLAFDSIVQRDAPEANQGQAFAQFETKFQLAWVGAGIVPVLISIALPISFLMVGLLAAFAAATYLISNRRLELGKPLPLTVGQRAQRRWQAVKEMRAERRELVRLAESEDHGAAAAAAADAANAAADAGEHGVTESGPLLPPFRTTPVPPPVGASTNSTLPPPRLRSE